MHHLKHSSQQLSALDVSGQQKVIFRPTPFNKQTKLETKQIK